MNKPPCITNYEPVRSPRRGFNEGNVDDLKIARILLRESRCQHTILEEAQHERKRAGIYLEAAIRAPYAPGSDLMIGYCIHALNEALAIEFNQEVYHES